MKVDVYSVMRNEVKMVPYFLRHYETFADRIFVWDHRSDDGTREVLEAHPKVTVTTLDLERPDDGYFVNKLYSQYRNSRGYADWAICVDGDEFVYHSDMLHKLEELKEKGVGKVRCEGFVMYHPVFPTTEGQIYDEVKMGMRDDQISTKVTIVDPEIELKWTHGRHHCSRERLAATDTGILLLHFRLMGYDYYHEKSCKNEGFATSQRVHRTRKSMSREKFEDYMSTFQYTQVIA